MHCHMAVDLYVYQFLPMKYHPKMLQTCGDVTPYRGWQQHHCSAPTEVAYTQTLEQKLLGADQLFDGERGSRTLKDRMLLSIGGNGSER
eukprot:8050660-Ditylum_brightwellii.AAC.1